MSNAANKIIDTGETLEEQALRQAKEQLKLINDLLEREDLKRILDSIHIALPFLSDEECSQMTDKIIKFRATSVHTTKCVDQTTTGDLSFLIDRTKNLKSSICEIFDDLMFYIQFTKGVDKTAADEATERTELRYQDLLHVVANAYREMTNLPIIEIAIRLVAPQGKPQSFKRPYIR